MKTKINKSLILITGISSIFVVLGILTVTAYYGLKENISLLAVMKLIIFQIEIQMGFFLVNSILIAILCLDLRRNKLTTNYYFPVIVFSVLMLVVNLILLPKNIMAVNGSLFWLIHIIFQYQNRKSRKSDEAMQKA